MLSFLGSSKGMGLLSMGMDLFGQYQQYQAQQAAAERQTERHRQNVAQALTAEMSERADLMARATEHARAARQQIRRTREQQRQQISRERAAVAESGAAGPSVQARESELRFQGNRHVRAHRQQHQASLRQIERRKQSLPHKTRQRMNQTTPGVEPSAMNLVLGMGTSALQHSHSLAQAGGYQGPSEMFQHWGNQLQIGGFGPNQNV